MVGDSYGGYQTEGRLATYVYQLHCLGRLFERLEKFKDDSTDGEACGWDYDNMPITLSGPA
jgi:hypothetical protein